MKEIFDENYLRRFLLGELSESDQNRIEDAVFDDADLRALVESSENDLIDEYARGELADAERARFEKMFFNSAERRERIEFARALINLPTAQTKVAATEKPPNFWQSLAAFFAAPQIAFAAIALLLAGFAAYFLISRQTENQQMARRNDNQNFSVETPANNLPSLGDKNADNLENENRAAGNSNAVNRNVANANAASRNAENKNPANRNQANQNAANQNGSSKSNGETNANKNAGNANQTPPVKNPVESAPTFAALVFPAGLTRDDGGGAANFRLNLPAAAKRARLIFNLEAGDDFPRYQINLTSRAGAPAAQSKAAPRNRRVLFEISAVSLAAGFYTAELRGVNPDGTSETVGYYDFEVVKP